MLVPCDDRYGELGHSLACTLLHAMQESMCVCVCEHVVSECICQNGSGTTVQMIVQECV